MAARIGLVCLAWWLLATTSGRLLVMGQCGWYGGAVPSPVYSEEPSSSGDISGVLSYEEESLEYYPVRRSVRHYQQHQQQLHQQHQYRTRSSRYTGNYGYANDYQREGARDYEKRSSGGRKTLVRDRKARRPVEGYGKSERIDYVQRGPPETTSTYGERRKPNRATKYAGEEYGPAPSPPPHQTSSLSFKVLPPKPSCAQNLLIGCTPTVTRVPCSSSLHGGYGGAPVPHYPPVPVHYNYHEPSTGYGYAPPPPHAGYHQSPPPPPAPPAPAPAPISEPYHQPAPEPAYHHQPPTVDGPPEPEHGSYVPSYKMSSAEQFPGFAAPVREELSESPKLPVISAFSQQPPADLPATTVASDTAGAPAATVTTTTPATSHASTPVSGARVGEPVPPVTPVTQASAGTTKDDFWNDTPEESSTDLIEGSTAR